MTDRLLLSEPLRAPGMRVLAARRGLTVEVLPQPTEASLAARLGAADGVVLVMERPHLTGEMVRAARRLRVACRCGAGYDNLDVMALTESGVPLVTTGDANADTVAEHALYLMLALAKRGPRLDREIKGGGWPRSFGGIELRDRTCLVVGYGHVGRRIARLAAAFAMRVAVADPHQDRRIVQDGHAAVALDEALPDADFVVLACALTPATRRLMDAGRLRRMKATAFLVNVARGAVVDETALAAALCEGRLAGAGLDVLEIEPPRAGSALLTLDNVVLTPHTAAYVATAYDRMAVKAAENALAGLDGRLGPDDVVNPEAFRLGRAERPR
jgi:D-3-phosphoglycerate dehydrogenase